MQVQMAGGCAGRAELAAPASPAAQETPAVPVVPARHAGHADGQAHHHHTHAPASRHEHGHHLLQVEDLSVGFLMYDPDAESFFGARKKVAWAIERMSIAVHAGEIVAVVGASGSGKTLLADAVMGLFELLRNCSRVYTIVREDGFARAKLAQYEAALERADCGDVAEKTRRCALPVFQRLPRDLGHPEGSELAQYVEKMLLEEERSER